MPGSDRARDLVRQLAATTLLALLLSGCALRGPARRPVRPVTAEELLAGLATRRAAVTSLRARGRLRTGLEGVWTREALLVRRPDAVRIDVLSPFGLAMALGVHGTRLWAYPPSEGARYEGPATPANLRHFLGAPVAVADVVDILLGVPPGRTPAGRPTLTFTPEGDYRLRIPLRDGEQTIWFASDTHLVLRAEETRDDALALRVAFDDYRDGFPYSLDVQVPGRGAPAKFTYETVEANVPVDPSLFAPPPARRVLPLEGAPNPTPH